MRIEIIGGKLPQPPANRRNSIYILLPVTEKDGPYPLSKSFQSTLGSGSCFMLLGRSLTPHVSPLYCPKESPPASWLSLGCRAFSCLSLQVRSRSRLHFMNAFLGCLLCSQHTAKRPHHQCSESALEKATTLLTAIPKSISPRLFFLDSSLRLSLWLLWQPSPLLRPSVMKC